MKGQDDSLFYIVAGKLADYHIAFPVEKIHIHQDRTVYTSGETLWFKAYQSFSKGIEHGSSVLYVDLMDGKNRLVASSKWPLEDGTASGHIALSDTLATGRYLLRAYTQWMQNFDADGFFTQEILLLSSHQADTGQVAPPLARLPVQLHLFPEGGNLVEGLFSKVAFKVIDNRGKGVAVTGVILDEEENEVQHFQTVHNGMGYFLFKPQPGKRYTARLTDHSLKVALPEAYPKGIVIDVRYREDKMRITLRHNVEVSAHSSPLYLTIHQHGQTFINTSIDLNNPVSIVDISNEKLPEGIFTLTVYDAQLTTYCERLAFVNYPKQTALRLTTDETSYGRRKKVSLQLETNMGESAPQTGSYSLAIVQSDRNGREGWKDFYTNYFLQSELKGRIEEPASYLAKKDLSSLKKLDLLLITHGWRRYVWNDMMQSAYPNLHYPVEPGLSFSGSVKMGRRQKGEDVVVTAIFQQDSIREILSGHPMDNGLFSFTGYHFYDRAEVIVSATDTKLRVLDVALNEPVVPHANYSYQNEHAHSSTDSLTIAIFGNMPEAAEGIDKKTYQLPDIQITARAIRQNPHQRHNSTFNMSTYDVKTDFSYTASQSFGDPNTGALAILAHIPAVRTLHSMGKGYLQSAEAVEPYYILDGVRVPKQTIASTNANMISRVEVLTPAAAMLYGSGSHAGAVAFYTKSWKELNSSIPTRTVIQPLSGYNQPKEFYSPDYSAASDYIDPDYRKTLLWIPDVRFDTNGKANIHFYTSDDTGAYTILCEGRSANERIGTAQSAFYVF
ncbi:MAG: TonB-dependent receptor plug domain-containing protein [Tannerellaceae bacterium]|nr:TonB-dependent receptor plug domain-containing protein [Tannerellaceae bacterium]